MPLLFIFRWSLAIILPASTTTATVSAASTAATASAASATAIFAGTGLVDDQVAAVVFGAVELSDRGISRVLARHLDEAETAGTARFAVHNDVSGIYFTGRGEMFLKVLASDAEGQVTYV